MKLLRPVFLLLLLANALLYAWWQGYLAPWGPASAREPQRLAAQVAPDKLKLIPAAAPVVAAASPAAEAAQCRLFEGIEEAEIKALLAAPKTFPDLNLTAVTAEASAGYDISIASLPTQAAAQAKQAEIQALGIETPSAVASDPAGGYRVVLARAPDQPAAELLLRGFKEKGVKTARILPLPALKVPRLEARGPAAAFAPLDARLVGVSNLRTRRCDEN